MQPIPQRSSHTRVPPELEECLGQLEGQIAPNELAMRIVRAAMALPGVAGARLWRVEQDEADVWAELGMLPSDKKRPEKTALQETSAASSSAWTGALGSDDFRVRILEVHGEHPFAEEAKSQLALLGRFAALALALA